MPSPDELWEMGLPLTDALFDPETGDALIWAYREEGRNYSRLYAAVHELLARVEAEKQRADEWEKRCVDLEILAEKWCEYECLASTCDDCPLEGRNV